MTRSAQCLSFTIFIQNTPYLHKLLVIGLQVVSYVNTDYLYPPYPGIGLGWGGGGPSSGYLTFFHYWSFVCLI